MADYAPVYAPGESITSQASAAITAGQLVMVSGSGTVAKTSGATTAWVGVAAFDASSGDKVTLRCGGVQSIVNNGGVTAGDQVISAANGKVATLAAASGNTAADINAARQVVGIALETVADGLATPILMVR
jgi:hypothetical protein